MIFLSSYDFFTRFKYLQIILKFFVVSIVLDRTGFIFPIVREITPIKKVLKHLILESNQECTKT
jgi:hypothetical protein